MFSFQGAIRLGLPALPIRHRPNGDFYNISQEIDKLQLFFSSSQQPIPMNAAARSGPGLCESGRRIGAIDNLTRPEPTRQVLTL
jgi:hypothetical protein